MQSFPGTASVCVTYTLTDANELLTEMRGTTGGRRAAGWAGNSHVRPGLSQQRQAVQAGTSVFRTLGGHACGRDAGSSG